MADDPASEAEENARLMQKLFDRTTDISIRIVALTELLEDDGVFSHDEYLDKCAELLAIWNSRHTTPASGTQVERLRRYLEPDDPPK